MSWTVSGGGPVSCKPMEPGCPSRPRVRIRGLLFACLATDGEEHWMSIAEGFMPAQTMHIELGPRAGWWRSNGGVGLGQRSFDARHLRRWPSAVSSPCRTKTVLPGSSYTVTLVAPHEPGMHLVNPKSGLNVLADSAGNYISGRKLGADQLKGLVANGRLF